MGHPRLATLSLGGGSSSCYLDGNQVTTDQGPLLIAASGLPSCHLATLPPCPAPAVNLYLALGRRGLGLRWAVAAGFCLGRATPPFAAQRSGCEGGAGPAPAAVRGYIGRGAGAVPSASLQLLAAFYIFGYSFQKFVCSPPSLATLPQLPHPPIRVISHSF